MKYLAPFFLILFVLSDAHGQEWRIFNSPSNTYIVAFPSVPQSIQDTSIYAGKDAIGNLFAVQEFTPPEEVTKNQSSREILKTTIKTFALKKNFLLFETTYSKYKGDYVAVDFTGKIKTNNRPLKGRIILKGKKVYIIYAILFSESKDSINNYSKFIYSFKLIN